MPKNDELKKSIAETAFLLFRTGKTIRGASAYDIVQDEPTVLHLRIEATDPPNERYFSVIVREDT